MSQKWLPPKAGFYDVTVSLFSRDKAKEYDQRTKELQVKGMGTSNMIAESRPRQGAQIQRVGSNSVQEPLKPSSSEDQNMSRARKAGDNTLAIVVIGLALLVIVVAVLVVTFTKRETF